jgi:hypothetical protein
LPTSDGGAQFRNPKIRGDGCRHRAQLATRRIDIAAPGRIHGPTESGTAFGATAHDANPFARYDARMVLSRRSLFAGLGASLVTAPAIVRAASLKRSPRPMRCALLTLRSKQPF